MKRFTGAVWLLSLLVSTTLNSSYDEPAAVSPYQFEPYPQDERLLQIQPILNGERHLVVMVCSYNNQHYYEGNLASIFGQKYSNYHVIYVDDHSDDGTFLLVKKYVIDHGMQDKVVLLRNIERRKALANLYHAIHLCDPHSIILILDGDDRFSYDGVMQRINQAYSNPNVWLTYGQFRVQQTGQIGFCQPYPQNIIERNGFRYYPPTPSHLRTFYAALFHKINIDDLMFQGDFFPMTYDLAIMFPMMEMVGFHHQFIGDVLVDYNEGNPINDHKVGKGLQRKYDLIIRARTAYKPLSHLF